MVKKIRTYLNEGDTYYGLEIFEQHNEVFFHLLEVKRKKQELLIVQEHTHTNWEDVAACLKKSIPLYLVVNTNSVLSKITKAKATTDYTPIVENTFPNLDFNNFYYQVIGFKENLYVAISKKAHVASYLKKLNQLNVSTVGFSLGIASMSSIFDYIDTKTIRTNSQEIISTPTHILEIQPIQNEGTPIQYTINELKVSSTSILSFSAVIQYIFKNTKGGNNFEDDLKTLAKNFTYKRQFKVGLQASLVFILGLLLINFLFFNYYYDKVQQLEESSEINSGYINKLNLLKERVDIKERRVDAVLSSANSKTSLFLDEIAKNIPKSILLSEIEYQPLLKPVQASKQIEIYKNSMTVSGATNNSEEFSLWIENVEKIPWVHAVETLNYDYTRNNFSDFSIKIRIHEQ